MKTEYAANEKTQSKSRFFFCKKMKFLSSKGREDAEIFWSKEGKDSGKEKVLRGNYLVSVGEGKL